MATVFDFKDQVAIVTGGVRGIGKSIAETFARAGAITVVTYANSSGPANDLVANLSAEGCRIYASQVDIANTEAMAAFIDSVHKQHGRIDILVNNAGIIRDTLILTMNKKDWQDVIDTNLTGAYNAIKPVSRVMLKQKRGSIINLSSIVGTRPGRGHANYAATKAGIEAVTKAIAAELGAKNIRVNAVAPGMIETDMTQLVREHGGEKILESISLRRAGKPEDIANAVAFLASDYASYITGAVLHVDGGM